MLLLFVGVVVVVGAHIVSQFYFILFVFFISVLFFFRNFSFLFSLVLSYFIEWACGGILAFLVWGIQNFPLRE